MLRDKPWCFQLLSKVLVPKVCAFLVLGDGDTSALTVEMWAGRHSLSERNPKIL